MATLRPTLLFCTPTAQALPSATGTPRYCRCWLPEKRFSYFNPRTERDSTRIARWNEGMAFFLEVAMDSAVYDVLMANPLVMGIQDREEYCGETFPRPLSDEYMAGVHEWEQTADRKQETQWQYELMGRGKDTMRAPGRGRGGRGRGRGRGTRDIFAPEVAYERNEGNIDWYRRTGQVRGEEGGERDRRTGRWQGGCEVVSRLARSRGTGGATGASGGGTRLRTGAGTTGSRGSDRVTVRAIVSGVAQAMRCDVMKQIEHRAMGIYAGTLRPTTASSSAATEALRPPRA